MIHWIPSSTFPPKDKESKLPAPFAESVPVLAVCKDGTRFVGHCFTSNIDNPQGCTWYIHTAMGSTKKITKKVTHWTFLPDPPENVK